jgi:hypothetical protein
MADPSEESLEQRLRRALVHEADAVRPGDGWAGIHARIAARPLGTDPNPRPRRLIGLPTRRIWTPLAAAAAILVLAVAAATLLRTVRPAPVPPATVAGRPSPLPVYYLAQQQDRWALVREYLPTELTDPRARLEAALRAAVIGRAADPDYTSAWRRLAVGQDDTAELPRQIRASATATGIQVQMPGYLLTLAPGTPAAEDVDRLAGLARDQLVWTATATAGRTVPVTLTRGPGPTDGPTDRLFGAVPIGVPEARLPDGTDPRAPIWVSSITDGQQVRAGAPITVRGDADLPLIGVDSPLRWRLETLGDSPATVADGDLWVVDNLSPPSRSTWEVQLPRLAAGRYVLTVTYLGWADTKRLDVRP